MKIIVFGAGGKVGTKLVTGALHDGYDVTAFVHRTNPFSGASAHLSVITGDITDAKQVQEAVQGGDIVLSALGSWHTTSKNILTQGMESIIPAMQRANLSRLITLTGSGAFYSADTLSTFDRLNHRFFTLMAAQILEDAEQHLRLLEASNLEWTSIRSPTMLPGSSAKYRLSSKLNSPLSTINRSAVVRCMLDQIKATDQLHAAPVIYRFHA
jgi:putative NADH-flavin reductase